MRRYSYGKIELYAPDVLVYEVANARGLMYSFRQFNNQDKELSMVCTLFVTLGCLGLPSAVTKYVAEYVGRIRLDTVKSASIVGF